MTRMIVGRPGKGRRLRIVALLLTLAVAGLVVGTQAFGADPDAGSYTIVTDENGPNDVPGQKDLNLQGIDTSSLASGIVRVLWNWDETGSSGNNSLDACALFDTDTDSKANFAVCATTQGSPATLKTTTVYTCGDTRVDRCASPITPVSGPGTSCTVTSPSATDPFDGTGKNRGDAYPNDTRAKCTIALADVGGATVATLINTCSYPSTQPNSDPSDCVLVPRDAFLTIVKVADPANQGTFPFHLDGSSTAVFTALGSQTSSPIAITTANNATHSVREAVPTGWTLDSASCTGASDGNGTYSASTKTISGIDARPDDSITCTFTNTLQRGSINVTKTGSDAGSQVGAVFTLSQNGTTIGTCTVDATGQCGSNPSFGNLLPGSYSLDETTVPTGYTKPGTLPATVTVTSGQTTSVSYVDTAQPGSASIAKVDDAGNPVAGATFTVYSPAGVANGVPTGTAAASCTTDQTGACTISSLAAGTYTIDETTVPTGYAKDATFPKSVTITRGQATTVNATDARQFRVVVLVCRQTDNSLYPSTVSIDGVSQADSLSSTQATAAGLTAAQQASLCQVTAGARGGLKRADNPHSATVTIP